MEVYQALNADKVDAKSVGEQLKESIKIVDKGTSDLKELGRAIVPEGVRMERQELIDYNIATSFKMFIDEMKETCEIAILGQAGTTRNDEAGSFAKAQTMQLTTDNIKWADVNVANEMMNIYIKKTLPYLTQSIKPEEIEFSFIFDDNADVSTFADVLRTLSTIPIRTLDNKKGVALPVSEVFRGLGMAVNNDYYNENDMFLLGDGDNQFMATEVNKLIYDNIKVEDK